MTKLFDILPGWVWALIAAGAFLTAGVQQVRLANERTAHADTRTQFAQQTATAQEAARTQSEKYRATEQELQNAQATIQDQTRAFLDVVERSRVAARVASDRLQDAANDLAAVARSRCAVAPAAGHSTPGDDPIGVLADVLGRADRRAGDLAAVADESRIRGLACERAYDIAREALTSAKTAPESKL